MADEPQKYLGDFGGASNGHAHGQAADEARKRPFDASKGLSGAHATQSVKAPPTAQATEPAPEKG